MIISVASGKGGTGKTTVSTNLAAALGKKITFLDCDVEEPNAHLFLNPDIRETKDVYSYIPKVDASLCDQCRKCVDICRFGAITLVGGTILVFPDLCHGCEGCEAVCPQKAVSEDKKVIGTIASGKINGITFHHGLLRIGEAMSPPLIKKLRQDKTGKGDVIIDAPPGTSCPVIAAMHGVDYVVLVTEPTPFGLHDLQLAHETVQALEIPCGLVINRADLGDKGVEQYAEKHNLPILLKIPFSKEIAQLYSRGHLLVEKMAEWKAIFHDMYREIEHQVDAHKK